MGEWRAGGQGRERERYRACQVRNSHIQQVTSKPRGEMPINSGRPARGEPGVLVLDGEACRYAGSPGTETVKAAAKLPTATSTPSTQAGVPGMGYTLQTLP